MVLTQQAEVLLDLVMAVIGGGLGWSHAGRIVCRTPGVTLESVHRYAKKAVTGIAVALGTVLVLSLAGIIRSIAWMFPLTFELLYPYLKWGVLSCVLMYVGGLSWGGAQTGPESRSASTRMVRNLIRRKVSPSSPTRSWMK